MRNPIRNAVVSITKRDLVSCKRCGARDLAWVQFKSGKWGLVETACQRPFWRGEGHAPEGLFAMKFKYHKCEEYLAIKAELERRASQCHPKADNPAMILADAMRPLIFEAAQNGGLERLGNENDPLGQAFHILMNAQSSIQNLGGVA